jgi:dolichol-phosphate mannosyltransferase
VISLVIPVYNEKESLAVLHGEIAAVAAAAKLDLEIVFVDDGSRDGSWDVIAGLAKLDPRVRGLRFRRNFGKAAALLAGFRAARGDRVVTLDADLQDDPKEIPRFMEMIDGGPAAGVEALEGTRPRTPLDEVSGWKKLRHDPWHKVYPSRVFNFLVSWLNGVPLHDHNCGMKAYRAEVFQEVRLYGELHRFIPVLAAARGFKVGELVINHRPRKFGHSKYGVWRFIKGFLDLLTVKFLTGFGRRPQHLLGAAGLAAFLAGCVGAAWLTAEWVVNRVYEFQQQTPPFPALHERPLLLGSVALMLLGLQTMSIGFIAELITAYNSRDEDSFSVAETAGSPEPPAHHGVEGAPLPEQPPGPNPPP